MRITPMYCSAGTHPCPCPCTVVNTRTCTRTCTCTQVDGKLICPKCAVRLGSYTWSGMQCSCGAWVAPAIQVVKSKVDEVLIKIG